MRWTREHLTSIDFDVDFLMLYLQRSILPEKIPGNQAAIRFEFTDLKDNVHWWVLVKNDVVDVCTLDPCREVDVYFTSTVKCLSDIWMGETTYKKEIRAGNLTLVGHKAFTKDVTSWMSNCMFAQTHWVKQQKPNSHHTTLGVAMNTFIALFRGVNVGGHNLLPMKDLKLLLEQEGFTSVKTYIQSGNVVLQAGALDSNHMAELIESTFGFRPTILVLPKAELSNALSRNPYPNFDGKTVHFYFCLQKPTVNAEKVKTLAASDETYQLIGKLFYLHAPSGIGRSKLVANIEACLGVPATGRNLNTVLKLNQMSIDASQ